MAALDHFLSTYQSRLDVKGRISIPAPFRTALRALATDGSAAVMLRPSHTLPCIEAWPPTRFETWAEAQKQAYDPDADPDDIATLLFSETTSAEPDKEGRIVLDDYLIQHAGLNGSEAVTCAGLGNRFQLWEPATFAQRKNALKLAPPKRVGRA
jgi:MraZ protein